ncbi:hypothetical protein [Anabaena sp. CCY 9402-a]|uniref:hypothetical protein n=1 Tax=Anabaena sp. CCY 9402-a TaxID=3103867 RepID=UPI0039C639B3
MITILEFRQTAESMSVSNDWLISKLRRLHDIAATLSKYFSHQVLHQLYNQENQ